MDSSKFINVNLVTITDCDLYIDDTDGINNEKALTNISWVDSVEQELSSSMGTKMFMSEHKDVCPINIDNVIFEKIDCLTDINIMEYQTIIINNLRKDIKMYDDKFNEKNNVDNLILKLNWLKETSEYLSNKLGLVIILHKDNDPTVLYRSSYKFCDNNFECQYNYNTKKHYGCYAKHYVHNLVNADVIALLNYIAGNDEIMSHSIVGEIRKSVNTISFVIGHMYEELKNAQTFNFFNSKNNHIERNPKKKKVRKLINQN